MECEHCGNPDPVNCSCNICDGCEYCCPYPDETKPPPHDLAVPDGRPWIQERYVDAATQTGMYDH